MGLAAPWADRFYLRACESRLVEARLDHFVACWGELDDPRSGNAALHDFHELLMIAFCAVLCGGQSAVDMALFAKAKEPFLRGMLALGLPSHDTFSRLFRQLDPDQFRAVFQRFMTKFSIQCQGVIAIDGKVLRRSFDKASGKSPLHGQRLGLPATPGAGANRHRREIERDHRCPKTAADAVAERDDRDRRCAQLPTADRRTDRQTRRRLRPGPEGKPRTLHDDVRLHLDDPACNAETSKRRLPSRRSMPIMAASRRGRRRSRPISAGCRKIMSGPA